MSGKSALVTGGMGFMGSQLVDYLLGEGHNVTVLDNLVGGQRQNLAHHRDNRQLHIVEADVCDVDAIRAHFEGVDWYFT